MDIKQVATEILELLKLGLVNGGKVVSEQFPILCQQIIKWGLISNICTILLSVFSMAISYKLARFAIKKHKESEYYGDTWTFLSIPSIFVGIIFLILFWEAIFEIGKIISAPNVYLLDYFKAFLTPKSTG